MLICSMVNHADINFRLECPHCNYRVMTTHDATARREFIICPVCGKVLKHFDRNHETVEQRENEYLEEIKELVFSEDIQKRKNILRAWDAFIGGLIYHRTKACNTELFSEIETNNLKVKLAKAYGKDFVEYMRRVHY